MAIKKIVTEKVVFEDDDGCCYWVVTGDTDMCRIYDGANESCDSLHIPVETLKVITAHVASVSKPKPPAKKKGK